MPGIPEEVIEEVRSRVDIIDLIQSYIPLKKQGRDFKACCPFHSEKTPSFVVRPDRQYYHCFGCGKHGNAFTFVMERENVDFPTAVRLLAGKYNIYIPEREERGAFRGRQTPPGEAPGTSMKDRLFLLHEKLREWYARNLRENPDSPVAEYLKTRKLSEESVRAFSLGMSLDSWDAGMVFAKNQGFSDAELAAGGIIKTFEDNPSKKYDMFRNRLMFPIWDELGRVVGFSARTIEADPKMMKYVNTPETPIFRKGRILYGMHIARSEMADSKKGCAILCEGQLDVIAMHAAGFPNSVAAEGTAFTPEQARMLRRYTGRVRLALDSDNAGTKAVFRDAEILLPLGFELSVVRFPGGKDPDELLRTHGREAIEEAVGSAVDFFEFAFAQISGKNGDSPAGKAATAEQILHLVSLLESEASKASYSAWLAGKLALSSDGMYAELRRTSEKEARERERYARYEREREARSSASPTGIPPAARIETPAEKRRSRALYEILEAVLFNEEAAEIAGNEIPPDLLDSSPLAVAVGEVIQAKMLDEWSEASERILKKLEPEGRIDKTLSELLMREHAPVPEKTAKKILSDDIRIVREFSVASRLDALMESFARMAPDDPGRKDLMVELEKLSRERAKILKGEGL